jgi:hypothetical protein
MSQLDVRIVESGARSTLYVSREGSLYRFYHDTKRWKGPIPPTVDGYGVSRHSHNRSLASLVSEAWDISSYRGANQASRKRPPAQEHLRIALSRLLDHRPEDVSHFADLCGVKTSTAWSYLCRIVEHWPEAHRVTMRLVYPPLLSVCEGRDCLKGSLRELMENIHEHLSGDTNWRCMDDHYSHLRLARLCIEAASR